MESNKVKLKKIFGSGPIGLLISILLFSGVVWLSRRVHSPEISSHRFILNTIFIFAILITVIIIVWSFKSLPPIDRGNRLCTQGVFKYVRHPLYAAFLSVFNFGLACYLNNYIFIVWALLLHPLWHYVVRSEEKFMVDIFKGEYLEYQKKTGRFFPKWIRY